MARMGGVCTRASGGGTDLWVDAVVKEDLRAREA